MGLDWKEGLPKVDGRYKLRDVEFAEFDRWRIDGDWYIPKYPTGGSLTLTNVFEPDIVAHCAVPPEPLPPAVESKEPELLPWVEERRGIRDGSPWLAIRVPRNGTLMWRVYIYGDWNYYGDEELAVDLLGGEAIDPNTMAETIQRLTRERDHFKLIINQLRSRCMGLTDSLRQIMHDADCAIQPLSPSTPSGETEPQP